VRSLLSDFRKFETLSAFADDLDHYTLEKIVNGLKLNSFLSQVKYSPMSIQDQLALFSTLSTGGLQALLNHQVSLFVNFYQR